MNCYLSIEVETSREAQLASDRAGGRPASAMVRRWLTQLVSRIAGLPIAFRTQFISPHAAEFTIRSAYARRFWKVSKPSDVANLLAAILAAPAVVISLAIWSTWRNAFNPRVRARRAATLQFIDQLRLYFTSGILAPWYYIFELFEDPSTARARQFINRCESKCGIIPLLKERVPPRSIVNNKLAFEQLCRQHRLPTVASLALVSRHGLERLHDDFEGTLDWIVKPVTGKGGRQVERWDHIGADYYRSPDGQILDRDELLYVLLKKARKRPRLIQPRLTNHPALADLSNGALATIRALTCLDERNRPELVGAVLRMAVGQNHVVDNLHAGGIVAEIDLDNGRIGFASNLGSDVRMGWLSRHPTSGAPIAGLTLPYWAKVRALAKTAHARFADRTIIGWDIAITDTGPLIVEANGGPDLDIMQRASGQGLMAGRAGNLLCHHLVCAKIS